MASITYRAIGADGEPQFGQGQANFLSDRDAVGQAIFTRLRLFLGEWWADKGDGTPWWQQILGRPGVGQNAQVIDLIFQSRILGTPFVLNLQNVQSSFNRADRSYKYHGDAFTSFGQAVAIDIPTPPSHALPGAP